MAPGGRVDAIFYDRRNKVENRGNDVYYTYSTDRGRRFAANRRLTRLAFDSQIGARYAVPSAVGLVEFGSRIALSSGDERVLAAWTDTRKHRARAALPGHLRHPDPVPRARRGRRLGAGAGSGRRSPGARGRGRGVVTPAAVPDRRPRWGPPMAPPRAPRMAIPTHGAPALTDRTRALARRWARLVVRLGLLARPLASCGAGATALPPAPARP